MLYYVSVPLPTRNRSYSFPTMSVCGKKTRNKKLLINFCNVTFTGIKMSSPRKLVCMKLLCCKNAPRELLRHIISPNVFQLQRKKGYEQLCEQRCERGEKSPDNGHSLSVFHNSFLRQHLLLNLVASKLKRLEEANLCLR